MLEMGARFPGDIAACASSPARRSGSSPRSARPTWNTSGGPEGVPTRRARCWRAARRRLRHRERRGLRRRRAGADRGHRRDLRHHDGRRPGDRWSPSTTSCAPPSGSSRRGEPARSRCRSGGTTRRPTPPPPSPPRSAPGSTSPPHWPAWPRPREPAAGRAVAHPVGPAGPQRLLQRQPDSMAAALRSLALVDAPRRVAVLGEMAELGDGRRRRPPRDRRPWPPRSGSRSWRSPAPATGASRSPTQDEALDLVEDLPAGQRGAPEGQPARWASTAWPTACARGGSPDEGPPVLRRPERGARRQCGSIKPWVTYLQADPTAELTVVFVDRELRAFRLPPVYYYANTCADFETQLRTLDLELGLGRGGRPGEGPRRRRAAHPR